MWGRRGTLWVRLPVLDSSPRLAGGSACPTWFFAPVDQPCFSEARQTTKGDGLSHLLLPSRSADGIAQESSHVEQPVIRSRRGGASPDPQGSVERIHRKRRPLGD